MRRNLPSGASQDLPGAESDLRAVVSPTRTRWLLLARILRPQGRRGEVLAELLTDFPERFAKHPDVFLAPQGFTGLEGEAKSIRVTDFFLPLGRNHGRIVLTLEGVDSITTAGTLAQLDVLVPEQERLEPAEDTSYVSDLIGCSLYDIRTFPEDQARDVGMFIGIVDDVHFPMSPSGARRLEEAAPLLSVSSPDGSEILIPYVKAYLVKQDLAGRTITMDLPEGLLDVNR